MKHIFTAIFLCLSISSFGQRLDDSTLEWKYVNYLWDRISGYSTKKIEKSELIQSRNYLKMNNYFFRQDSMNRIFVWYPENETDYLIMDTSKSVGDTFFIYPLNKFYVITKKSKTVIGGISRTIIELKGKYDHYYFIDGIGNTMGNPILYFTSFQPLDAGTILICMHRNGIKEYESSNASRCVVLYTSYLAANKDVYIWKSEFSNSNFKSDSQFVFRKFSNDSITINNKLYYRVYESLTKDFNSKKTIGYIRNQGYQIYLHSPKQNKEFLIYDLNAHKGDSIYLNQFNSFQTVEKTYDVFTYFDIKFNLGTNSKHVQFQGNSPQLIEIVGSTGWFGFMERDSIPPNYDERIICVTENNMLVYENPLYKKCYGLEIQNNETKNSFSISQDRDIIKIINQHNTAFKLSIYNTLGENVISNSSLNESIQVDMHLYPRGMYILKIEVEGGESLIQKINLE